MLFYIKYGCNGCGEEVSIIDAKSVEEAIDCAYSSAISYREHYEGLYGILDYVEYCEENGYNSEEVNDYVYGEYMDMVQDELIYSVEPYDENNEDHVSALEQQEDSPYEI